MRLRPALLKKLENVFFLEFNLKLLQQRQILLSKRSPFMVSLLILDVTNDHIQLRMSIGERSITLLPRKLSTGKFSAIYPVLRIRLYVTNELGDRHCRT